MSRLTGLEEEHCGILAGRDAFLKFFWDSLKLLELLAGNVIISYKEPKHIILSQLRWIEQLYNG